MHLAKDRRRRRVTETTRWYASQSGRRLSRERDARGSVTSCGLGSFPRFHMHVAHATKCTNEFPLNRRFSEREPEFR